MPTKKPPYGESYIKQSTYKAKCKAWQDTIGELTEKNKALFDSNVQLEADVDELRTKVIKGDCENDELRAENEALKILEKDWIQMLEKSQGFKKEKEAPQAKEYKAQDGSLIVRDEFYITDNGEKVKIVYIDESDDESPYLAMDDSLMTTWLSLDDLHSTWKEPAPEKPRVVLNKWIKHTGEVRPVELFDTSRISLVTKDTQLNHVNATGWTWKQSFHNPIIYYKIHSL